MKKFQPTPEPTDFSSRCRDPGALWLQRNPNHNGRPKDFWSQFEGDLRCVFGGLCAYSVMTVSNGHVDHFVPIALLRKAGRLGEAYEWSNFRFADPHFNQKKGIAEVLDPFKVEDDWFELLLPSLQLRLTDKVPATCRKLAEFTICNLGLDHGEKVVRYRQEFFRLWQAGRVTIDFLDEWAPLIARAIRLHPVYGASLSSS